MAYNDAPFTKDDWTSIQSIHDSVKATDVHKVGKFGIGFNSVYHITGIESIEAVTMSTCLAKNSCKQLYLTRACRQRVIVVCLCVCLSVCYHVISASTCT